MKSTTPRQFPTQLAHFNAIAPLCSLCLHLGSTLLKIKGKLWLLLSMVQLYKVSKQPQKQQAQANGINHHEHFMHDLQDSKHALQSSLQLPSVVQFHRQIC